MQSATLDENGGEIENRKRYFYINDFSVISTCNSNNFKIKFILLVHLPGRFFDSALLIVTVLSKIRQQKNNILNAKYEEEKIPLKWIHCLV